MACKVVFTCVPMGRKATQADGTAVAVLDVLAVPHCDDPKDIVPMLSWPDAIMASKDKFTVNGAIGARLVSDAPMDSHLWRTLFGDAGTNKAKARTTPIAPSGVSLDVVHKLCHDFYASANARVIDSSRHGPDLDFLRQLHGMSIEQYGLYAPADSSATRVPITAKRKVIAGHLSEVGGGTDEANADALIRGRFGVIPPTVDHVTGIAISRPTAVGDGAAVQPPVAAGDALSALKLDLIASLKTANGAKYRATTVERPPHLVYHINRAIASAAEKRTSHAAQVADMVFSRDAYSFNQRITMLLNMPALLETLGLVLHFELPLSAVSQLKSVKLDVPADLVASTKIEPHARITMSNAFFFPLSKSKSNEAIFPNSWINPGDGYRMGSLQLDSAAMQITQFASQAGLRQAGDPQKNAIVTVSYDEDVCHPILPPSPHTSGLYVWQDKLQEKVIGHRKNAEENQDDDNKPLYAEDLRTGVVIDVLGVDPNNATDEGTWIHLCRRDEEFNVNGVKIRRRAVDRGVKIAASRSVDPATTAPLAHDVDETIFTWRLGSLVAKSRLSGNPIASKTPVAKPSEESKQVPWTKLGKPKLTPSTDVGSPLFGWEYRVAMRAAFVTGSVVPFNPGDAIKAALPAGPFQRYELIQGPAVIPVTLTERYLAHQSPTLMFVGSRVSDDLSLRQYTRIAQRLIVPSRVTPDVARRHGKGESQISRGATILPLNNGSLPDVIDITTEPSQHTSGSYVPDPMCVGVIAILTDLDGKVYGTQSLRFYSNSKKEWPDYTPHMVQLEWSTSAVPSLTTGNIDRAPGTMRFLASGSRAFICRIPPGVTCLLALRPQLDQVNIDKIHAFSRTTRATRSDGTVDLVMLSLSDICRPTVVRLTHATDRPLKRPEVTMTPPLPNSLHVSISDPNSVILGGNVEPATTSKLALLASWSEFTDDLKQRSYDKKVLNSQLTEFSVPKKGRDAGKIEPTHIQFPFSDSRYRRLTITGRGSARYGDVFGGDPKLQTVDSPPVTLDVLATTEPKPPDIEYVLPNLRWDIQEEKRTRTMGLTIVLNRPWFSSGMGEQLAIITSRRSAASDPVVETIATSMPANTENKVSAWGVLADWKQGITNGAASQSITIFEDTQRVKDKDDAVPSRELSNSKNIQIGSDWYSVLLFTPRYNHQDQQWFVNLRLSAPPAYGTVVRLLTLRYQENAVEGKHVSDISMCDFSLLRPERSATIITKSQGISRKTQIQIHGCKPESQDGFHIPKTSIEVRYFDLELTRPHDFEWAAGQVIPSDDPLPPNSDVLWQATVPNPLVGGGGHLVVHENEVWPSAEDPRQTQELPGYFDILPL